VAIAGTSKDGFTAEWTEVNALVIREGRIARAEIYPDDELDAALARFEELRPTAELLDNAATRLQDGFADAFTRGAWDECEALMADDFTCEDRRRLRLFRPVHGASEFVAGNRAASEQTGLTRARGTPLAVRGNNLALWRVTLQGEDDEAGAPRWEHLGVTGVDVDGRCAFELMFDPEDLDAAYAELDARYAATEGAP
jgi:ketosteroid isomerase-like protein